MAANEIPLEFQDDLEAITPLEKRTDDEILESLRQHVPVTSEKNIWAYWHSGIDTLPKWCQDNAIDWVRICGPDWTVRVLDMVPGSPNYALKFAPKEILPKAFVEGTMTGPYVGPHSADFLRGALLYTYGGVNLDVGCILVRSIDRVCWSKLEDPACPYEIAVPVMYDQVIANHTVAARKGNPFIKRWHDLFIHLWKERTTYEGLSTNPLVSFVREVSLSESQNHDFRWDFKVPPSTVFEYITQVTCWLRLCMLEGTPDDPFSGSDYWQTHVMAIAVQKENWAAETVLGYENFGHRLVDLLKVRVDSDPESEQYKEAYKLVWRLLTGSSMQKISRGKDLVHSTSPGVLWDENPHWLSMPGTFGELLRYGAAHFRQKREDIALMEPKRSKVTLKKGLLEP